MRQKVIISIILVILLSALVFVILVRNQKGRTIEEITGVNFSDISYVKYGGAMSLSSDYDLNEFISLYRNNKYKKINEAYGNTTHLYIICYDLNDEVLFTLVDVGNSNKIFIKKGSFNINKDSKKLYQLVK